MVKFGRRFVSNPFDRSWGLHGSQGGRGRKGKSVVPKRRVVPKRKGRPRLKKVKKMSWIRKIGHKIMQTSRQGARDFKRSRSLKNSKFNWAKTKQRLKNIPYGFPIIGNIWEHAFGPPRVVM